MHYRRYAAGVFLAIVLASGCSNEQQGSPPLAAEFDPQMVQVGERVFRDNCAQCHGQRGEGHPNWRVPDAEGFYPPPPLNGTGHAWHHPRQVLREVILHGSVDGQGKMPAWKGKLKEDEVEAVITWFQSQWPEDVYNAWAEMQNRAPR